MACFFRAEFIDSRSNERPRPWHIAGSKDRDITYEDVQTIRASQSRLESSHAGLRKTLESIDGVPEVQDALQKLALAEAEAATHRQHIDRIDGWFPVTKRPSILSASKAEEVFHLPELLEPILLLTNPIDVLCADGVNRTWRNIVRGSSLLQKAAGIQPDNESTAYYCPDETLFGFKHARFYPRLEPDPFCLDPPYNKLEGEYRLCFTGWIDMRSITKLRLRIGSRLRSALICQPPSRNIKIRSNCFAQFEIDLVFQNGMTMGDFFNCSVYFESQHKRECKDCDPGWILSHVSFSHTIQLNADDPGMPVYLEREADRKARLEAMRRADEEWTT